MTNQPANAVVLVEGESDRMAVEVLAGRLGRDLAAEGVDVVAMGGASAVGEYLLNLGAGVTVAGLCDEAEVDDLRRGLERSGFGSNLSRTDMEALGFYLCGADLEDELIRALGTATVEGIIEGQGELPGFRTFQNQPEWRGRPLEAQLRRFLGIKSGRKIRYSRLLAEAVDLDRVPAPLVGVLAAV